MLPDPVLHPYAYHWNRGGFQKRICLVNVVLPANYANNGSLVDPGWEFWHEADGLGTELCQRKRGVPVQDDATKGGSVPE